MGNLVRTSESKTVIIIPYPNLSHTKYHTNIARSLAEREMEFLPLDLLITRAEVFVVESDHILDYPKPTLPNVKMIGGTAPCPAKALPPEFQSFMDSAKEGVVIVSFGTYVLSLPKHISDKILQVLLQLPMKSVFRSNLTSPDPKKILTAAWTPQNDLLGHPHTKVFVSHCGKNGQYEALYHAVPIVATPLFADQRYNAERVRVKGFAEVLDLNTCTTEQMRSTILTVANEPRYKQAVVKRSRLFRELYGIPMETAAYWLDHVMEYGGDYMRSAGQQMPLYQYLLLDVFLFIFVCSGTDCWTYQPRKMSPATLILTCLMAMGNLVRTSESKTVIIIPYPNLSHTKYHTNIARSLAEREMEFLPLDLLITRAEVFVVESDHILDYPKPTLPNVKMIGGTAPCPAKALPPEFQSFMDSAKEGVVIVSFGTYVLSLPKHISDKILQVLLQLPMKSVFRSNLTSPDPKKILTAAWTPQNDLLGHPHTKVFVSHCGKNGQYEALYHAVPIVATPLFADQRYNAERVRVKGFAEVLDLNTCTTEQMRSTILTVANEPRYKQAVVKRSRLFRELYGIPMETAAYWLDHVMEYGGDYMRSAGQQMPLYQYLLLDVFLFIFTGLHVDE
ncbi:UDP-glucuronosyltransferase 1-2-like [Babylonia areolata]|uniref:UDP-glucuronosyltransferase 1-2-like n=1 Tax=Babylonia areolata TaxID=304850 RepID=UPI003FD3F3B2